MKIALVTNNELWHKYWITELNSKYEVCLIFQANTKKQNFFKIIKNKVFQYGLFWGFLKICSIMYNFYFNNSMRKMIKKKEKEYFIEYDKRYTSISKEKVYEIESINSPTVIKLVKDNEIDIICNLGGDIFEKEIINSVNIACLNYHSGISPFYNGNKTIFHAVSDFRPNFAGGTLMYMTERIDGGKVISHYLVPIEVNDTAVDLFMKSIKGSVKLYLDALNKIESGNLPIGIEQKKTFKYVNNIDWTITNDIKLRYFQNKGRMKNYIRNEIIIDYSDGVGDHTFNKSLCHILNK